MEKEEIILENSIALGLEKLLNEDEKILYSFINEVLDIDIENIETEKFNVKREFPIEIKLYKEKQKNKLGNKRIDIVIYNSRYFIPLEIKVYAEDSEEQVKDYVESMDRFYDLRKTDRIHPLYYLSFNGSKPRKYFAKVIGEIDENKKANVQVLDFSKGKLGEWLKNCISTNGRLLKEKIENIGISEIKSHLLDHKIQEEFSYFSNNNIKNINDKIIEYLGKNCKNYMNIIDTKNSTRFDKLMNVNYKFKNNIFDDSFDMFFSIEKRECNTYWGIFVNPIISGKIKKEEIGNRILDYISNKYKEEFYIDRITVNKTGNWIFYKYIDEEAFRDNEDYRNKVLGEIKTILEYFNV